MLMKKNAEERLCVQLSLLFHLFSECFYDAKLM